MNSPVAFKATYSDFKLVKTRAVVQVIFEVPLADSNEVLDILGGMPNAANERWFGIAPLREPITDAPEGKQSKNWRELLPSAQAGIRCAEPIFWAFLREEMNMREEGSADNAASFVRAHCKVNSRAHFNSNPAAKAVWQSLDNQFQAWKAIQL
ncbi:hypothetical protein JQ628_11515 [Bradyrhizobium lablabi]|uniref:hypothetical protein n=1 Tax=Bradyrhizobium lablabi TaxID=722472 RepID=UPI001BAD0020|nr:hypothetical protein [Bradyrhizobium lablabi]MBR1122144.1 hypothetical protein [Bradyrhizobium lablabi]